MNPKPFSARMVRIDPVITSVLSARCSFSGKTHIGSVGHRPAVRFSTAPLTDLRRGAFLVMSTNPNPANAGLLPLETVFHEGTHQ
jgi:hypothetical protein